MFEITADIIAFVAPGDFPSTSSGKVQLGASRDGVMNGTLPVIHRDQLSATSADRYVVGEDGALIAHLERGPLDFLRREKPGSLEAVPHDCSRDSICGVRS